MEMICTLLRGYVVKNMKKFLIMIFAIAVSTTIIFGTTVARLSQSKYVSDEIYRQSPSYQIEVANMSKKDFDTILKDDNVKNSVTRKYYGNFTHGRKLSILEDYNNQSFKKLKHTLSSGRFPETRDEIIISDGLFKELKSQGKLTLSNQDSEKPEYDVELSYSKEYINKSEEYKIFNQTHKFKVVGTYKMTSVMEEFSEGDGIYIYKNFEYAKELVTYNGFIDLRTGFKSVQTKIDKLFLELNSGELNMQTNKALARAKEDGQSALRSFDLFDTGTIVASACIIFNVFNIMMKELIKEIGLLRVVGMSKKQSLAIFILKNLLVLIVGSLIGFLGGYLLAGVMMKYLNLTSGFMDVSKAPIYISKPTIMKTIKVTTSILAISTIIPIVTTIKSYPVNMMNGRLRNPFNVFDEIFRRLKIYRKIKSLVLNKFKKIKCPFKFKNVNLSMSANIAINSSKRNVVYIITTAIIVGMAGVYGVQKFITMKNFSDIGDTRIQNLGDYDIDLSYTGISKSKDVGISPKDVDKISSIKGITDIFAINITNSYTKLNISDLSKSYKKNLSIKYEDKEKEMKFEFIGLNKDALYHMNNEYKGLIESGRIYEKNDEIIEAVVNNNFLDQGYSDGQQKFNEKLRLGDILDLKVLTENKDKMDYKIIKIKIVGFLGEEWFARSPYTNSKTPDILIDSTEYAKITGNSNFSKVKIKSNKSKLENVKSQVKAMFKDKKSIGYSDKSTIKQETDVTVWQSILKDVINSAMLTITASINIVFSIVTSIAMRKREFGVMRSIGLSIKDLKKILTYEGLIYGLVSSFVGILLILHKGLTWSHLLRMTAKYQGVPYTGPLVIFPIIPTLIFVLITMIISLISVALTFKTLNKDSIVEQIRED